MNKIVASIIITLSFNVFAQQVPNTFEAGNPIVASEVNANFDALEAEINTLKAQLELLTDEATPRQFVGLTQAKTDGIGTVSLDGGVTNYRGVHSMDKRCDVEYPGSKMCNYEELEASPPSSLLNVVENAWRRPSIILTNSSGESVDVSSFTLGSAQCGVWDSNNPNSRGAALRATSTYLYLGSNAKCDLAQSIACCK